jgi:CBS domain-containing protein
MAILAGDVMTKAVVTVDPSLPALELERLLDRERISGAPVVEDGRLVGVVSRVDLVRAQTDASEGADALLDYYRDAGGGSPDASEHARLAGSRVEKRCVRDLMTTELVTVTPDRPVAEVARTLADRGIHRLLVVEKGRLCGLISSLDVVRLVGEGRLA